MFTVFRMHVDPHMCMTMVVTDYFHFSRLNTQISFAFAEFFMIIRYNLLSHVLALIYSLAFLSFTTLHYRLLMV